MQPTRHAEVQKVSFWEATATVHCGLCGEGGGLFVRLSMEARAIYGSKTFPVECRAHVRCLMNRMPARLLALAGELEHGSIVYEIVRGGHVEKREQGGD